MPTAIWDTDDWAEQNFSSCVFGDKRRNQRLVILATQMANRPDGSFPDQTECWDDLRAAYRFFDTDQVTPKGIIAPHCRMTRVSCQPGDVKLIINDTTEVDYTSRHTAKGLGPIGNGGGRGFFLHTGLMMDDRTGRVEGLAGQEIFFRKEKRNKKGARNTRRRLADRESVVWGKLMDQVGPPPEGTTWIHLCDRGADDIEVMWRALHNRCGFVIRASRLNRKIITNDGRNITLVTYLSELPDHGTREVFVPGKKGAPSRIATVTLRYGEVQIPLPSIMTPWLKEHRPPGPLRVGVTELIEKDPPQGSKAIRWVLYSHTTVTSDEAANQVIERYEKRPTIEDFHKALKSGCSVEDRQLHTGLRLERVAALCSVVAVRLLQLKTAAKETPDRPAEDLVPPRWLEVLKSARKRPASSTMTIRQFIRHLAILGGFLGRKGDGEPGWITLWRGFEKLRLILRGADAERRRLENKKLQEQQECSSKSRR